MARSSVSSRRIIASELQLLAAAGRQSLMAQRAPFA
jgi:hypothetical protein